MMLNRASNTVLSYEPCFMNRGLHAFAKSIDKCQLEQSVQADVGKNFPACQRTIILCHEISRLFDKTDFYRSIISFLVTIHLRDALSPFLSEHGSFIWVSLSE